MNDFNAYCMNFLLMNIFILILYLIFKYIKNNSEQLHLFEEKKNIVSKNKNIEKNIEKNKKIKKNIKKKINKTIKCFSVSWCGYCKDFLKTNGIWNKLKNKYSNKLNFKIIDCDINKNECNKNNIESYPSIILFLKNKKVLYNSDRSYKKLDKFLSKHIK